MTPIPTIFAKLAGIQKIVLPHLKAAQFDYLEGIGYYPVKSKWLEYFVRYAALRDDLMAQLPELYADLPIREIPGPDNGHQHLISGEALANMVQDIDYIFEVRANSELGTTETKNQARIFISHGSSQDWREIQAYIEKDIGIDTLELAQEANLGRTILQKLDEESRKCSFAVVVMTGDDYVDDGPPRVRENVMHEIGYFQGKFGLSNVCLLHEEGTNIPSNIHGVVYIPFPKGLPSASFGVLTRELKAAFSQY